MIDLAHEILSAFHPMTVRQVYYQLVSRQAIENTQSRYNAVCNALVDARLDGSIPWEWIEDRTRRPRGLHMYKDLSSFAFFMRYYYYRDVWATQPREVEVWLEKDALSGIFSDVLSEYGATLNVGRGYDGWSSIHNAAVRWGQGQDVLVLYFGDFDPSGEDMFRSLRERLGKLDCTPEMVKVSLTKDDIERHDLPEDFTKKTDTRSAAHIAKHGDVAVELDALPIDVLQSSLKKAVEQHMDLEALALVHKLEAEERERLVEVLRTLS